MVFHAVRRDLHFSTPPAGFQAPEPRFVSTPKKENPDKPAHQRPELPAFWDQRFARGTIPWDAGGVPRALQDFAARQDDGRQARRALIPGCGSAYEAGYLDARGWSVTALDFSSAAVEKARRTLGDWGGTLLCDDFFTFAAGEPFDLIYERAFLCALPRKCWPNYAPRMAQLLLPGGLLAGFFYLGDEPKGPPFAISPPALAAMLAPAFERIEDSPVDDSLAVFAGKERWQVWRRR